MNSFFNCSCVNCEKIHIYCCDQPRFLFSFRKMQMQPEVCVHVSSFYWISAYLLTMMAADCGGHKVVISRFDPEMLMNLIQKHKVSKSKSRN